MSKKQPLAKTATPLRSPIRPKIPGVFFKSPSLTEGYLELQDGKVFSGVMPYWQKTQKWPGEVVFNTGMTGYIESLTDPSYSGQILVFTYPLIGNYGVLPDIGESPKIQAAGVIVSEAALHWSHSKATGSFLEWLEDQHIPILIDVDTRDLTRHLRSAGTMAGQITTKRSSSLPNISLKPVFVSIDEPKSYNLGKSKTVIVVDCGAKENIIRSLINLDVTVKRVPADYDYTEEAFDGILLSNGPGDPTDYTETVTVLKKALKLNKPIFGICLGSQLLALAAGATTYKLPYGHRGHNQPCQQVSEGIHGRCVITSQNHGYAVDAESLPKDWRILFRNLNDESVEGIEHIRKPFFAVQFHPEACPGPTDSKWLFERFNTSL
jgi:carbamoyl-phosphate synthase small subunit